LLLQDMLLQLRGLVLQSQHFQLQLLLFLLLLEDHLLQLQ
jgi:hypothetical protein